MTVPSVDRTKLFIGEWRDAADGAVYDDRNPATGERLGLGSRTRKRATWMPPCDRRARRSTEGSGRGSRRRGGAGPSRPWRGSSPPTPNGSSRPRCATTARRSLWPQTSSTRSSRSSSSMRGPRPSTTARRFPDRRPRSRCRRRASRSASSARSFHVEISRCCWLRGKSRRRSPSVARSCSNRRPRRR